MVIISSTVYVYSVVVAVLNIVAAFKGKADGYETPKFTLMAKCLHIPAYVSFFVAGLLSFVMSVWVIGLLLLVSISSALLIFISGLLGVGGVIAARKAGMSMRDSIPADLQCRIAGRCAGQINRGKCEWK